MKNKILIFFLMIITLALVFTVNVFAIDEKGMSDDFSVIEFDMEPGEYDTEIKLTITSDDPNVEIHYSLDGKNPDIESEKYEDFILIDRSSNVRAVAYKLNSKGRMVKNSTIISGDYCIKNTEPRYSLMVDKSGEIIGVSGLAASDVVIPSEINGIKITAIGRKTFEDCKYITSVIIPDGVTSIGIRAFYKCENLISVQIPDSVTIIDYGAFADCISLEYLKLPKELETIGELAMLYCSSLKSIVIDESNLNYCTIDGVLFNKDKSEIIYYPAGKDKLEYEIPDTVEEIQSYAFTNCNNLEKITISGSVTDIENNAFAYCNSLTSINIPDNVTYIGEMAFFSCADLKEVSISKNIWSVGDYAFAFCDSLEKVTFNSDCYLIFDNIFVGDYNLTIYGLKDGDIQQYAEAHGLNFVAISSTDPEPEQEPTFFEKVQQFFEKVWNFISKLFFWNWF